MKIREEQKYLLYLIDCVLNDKNPQLPQGEFDWDYLAKYAEQQQFEQILNTVFGGANPGFDEKVWFHLEQRYGLSITRDTELEMVAEEICELFSGNEIKHMHLKGNELKKYYPLPEIRSSFDIDILIHNEDMEKALMLLRDEGYAADNLGGPVHCTLTKGKFHIELHRCLMPKYSPGYEFSMKVWENSKQKNNFTYVMENEFLYIYLLEHLRKHLSTGGAGLKLIIDFYALKKMPIDEQKLKAFLKEANLTALNQYVKLLIDKWFEGKDIQDLNVLLIEQLILNTSAYGDYDLAIKMFASKTDIRKLNTKKKIFSYMFLPLDKMKIGFPVLNKYPWLLPVMWIVRIIVRPKAKARSFIATMKDFTEEEAQIINAFLTDISK